MTSINRPVFPELSEFIPYLEKIWASGIITNNGPIVCELEKRLIEKMNAEYLVLTANCTQALEIMIHACVRPGRKKIITTPFSFAATLTSIVWTGFEPVFVDIDPETMNLNFEQVGRALSPDVGAVLACHLYGRPADDGFLQKFCDQNDIPLLFDGAHIFGVETAKGSLANAGTATALSFHATKVFGTVEGGAIVTRDRKLAEKFRAMRSFGMENLSTVRPGTNAKMSELHAAFGLASLPLVEDSISKRKKIWQFYREHLPRSVKLIDLEKAPVTKSNYAYAILSFSSEPDLLKAMQNLKALAIDTRRYFYPSLSQAPYAEGARTPKADDLSRRVLCIPLYPSLSLDDAEKICRQLGQS